jgi:vacuolar-type H+-ATPase subunit H
VKQAVSPEQAAISARGDAMEDIRTKPVSKSTEAEILNMLETAEQRLHQIIEEARKAASEETSRTFKELEQAVRQIIYETVKMAEADAQRIVAQAEEKGQQIIEEASKKAEEMEKAILELEGDGERRKAILRRRVELVIIPPVDFGQLEKLRLSLHQLAGLRILSMWGNSEGGFSIFAITDREVSLISDLRKIDVVEEAIEVDEALLASDLISDFVKNNLPQSRSKRDDELRVLVMMKRVE